MVDLTPLIQVLIEVIACILTVYVVKYMKANTTAKDREELASWVKIACLAAEQLYKTKTIQDRKQYVLNFLEGKGYNVNLDTIDKMIEATVLEINKGWVTNG